MSNVFGNCDDPGARFTAKADRGVVNAKTQSMPSGCLEYNRARLERTDIGEIGDIGLRRILYLRSCLPQPAVKPTASVVVGPDLWEIIFCAGYMTLFRISLTHAKMEATPDSHMYRLCSPYDYSCACLR